MVGIYLPVGLLGLKLGMIDTKLGMLDTTGDKSLSHIPLTTKRFLCSVSHCNYNAQGTGRMHRGSTGALSAMRAPKP